MTYNTRKLTKKRKKTPVDLLQKQNNSQNQEIPSPYGICTNVPSAFRDLLSALFSG